MQTISGMPDVEIYLSGEDPRFYKGGQINILLVSVGKAPASISGGQINILLVSVSGFNPSLR